MCGYVYRVEHSKHTLLIHHSQFADMCTRKMWRCVIHKIIDPEYTENDAATASSIESTERVKVLYIIHCVKFRVVFNTHYSCTICVLDRSTVEGSEQIGKVLHLCPGSRNRHHQPSEKEGSGGECGGNTGRPCCGTQT